MEQPWLLTVKGCLTKEYFVEINRARKRAKKNLRNEGYVSESGLNLDEALDNDLRNKKNVKKNNLEDLLSTK